MKLKLKFSLHSTLFFINGMHSTIENNEAIRERILGDSSSVFPLVVYIRQGNGNFYCLAWHKQNSDWHLLCCSAILTSLLLASPTPVMMNGKNFLFFLLKEERAWSCQKFWVGRLSPYPFILSWMRKEYGRLYCCTRSEYLFLTPYLARLL